MGAQISVRSAKSVLREKTYCEPPEGSWASLHLGERTVAAVRLVDTAVLDVLEKPKRLYYSQKIAETYCGRSLRNLHSMYTLYTRVNLEQECGNSISEPKLVT